MWFFCCTCATKKTFLGEKLFTDAFIFITFCFVQQYNLMSRINKDGSRLTFQKKRLLFDALKEMKSFHKCLLKRWILNFYNKYLHRVIFLNDNLNANSIMDRKLINNSIMHKRICSSFSFCVTVVDRAASPRVRCALLPMNYPLIVFRVLKIMNIHIKAFYGRKD